MYNGSGYCGDACENKKKQERHTYQCKNKVMLLAYFFTEVIFFVKQFKNLI
jgi:hypothetical protein